MGVPNTIVRVLKPVANRVMGHTVDITITNIKQVGFASNRSYYIPLIRIPSQETQQAIGINFFDVYQVYRVSASIGSQESTAYYGVHKQRDCLPQVLLNEENSQLVKKAIDAIRQQFPEISKLESDLASHVNLSDILFGVPQMTLITDYLAHHTEGLTIGIRTRSDGLPGNLLQKAYQALSK